MNGSNEVTSSVSELPFARLDALLAREGHEPSTVKNMRNGYREAIDLIGAGKQAEAMESVTPGVLQAWQLHMLDTRPYEEFVANRIGSFPYPIVGRDGILGDIGNLDASPPQPRVTIPAFDMEKLRLELMMHDGLTPGHADASLQDFMDFMAEAKLPHSGGLAPSKSADVAWHRLILDPMSYRAMCASFLGRQMHHVPNVGGKSPRLCRGDCVVPCAFCHDEKTMARNCEDSCTDCQTRTMAKKCDFDCKDGDCKGGDCKSHRAETRSDNCEDSYMEMRPDSQQAGRADLIQQQAERTSWCVLSCNKCDGVPSCEGCENQKNASP